MNINIVVMLFVLAIASDIPTTIQVVEVPEQKGLNIKIKDPPSKTIKIKINKEDFRCVVGGFVTKYPKVHKSMFCSRKKTKTDGSTFFVTYQGDYNKKTETFLLSKEGDLKIIRGRLRFLNATSTQIEWMQQG